MKKILGFDLGTASIGWALINKADNPKEKSSIIKLGVRSVPITVEQQKWFDGKKDAKTSNAKRTSQKGARKNLRRFKFRRKGVIQCLKEHHIIADGTILSEEGNYTTFQTYRNRAKAVTEEITLEELARVLLMLNKKRGYKSNRKAKLDKKESSRYLDTINDRSDVLSQTQQTVGQYLMAQLDKDPHYSLKNQVFYRQDYKDEFEKIWECQARYHQELTSKLKKKLRDKYMFFQLPLKSQKRLVSICEFENSQIDVNKNGKTITKTIGMRACPKSSPLFQEFKVWQILNNIVVTDTLTNLSRKLEQQEKEVLFKELTVKERLTKTAVLKTLFKKTAKNYDLNYQAVEGNSTMSAFYWTCFRIATQEDKRKYTNTEASKIIEIIEKQFKGNTKILTFDAQLTRKDYQMQDSYRLWHLLYSYINDESKTGTDRLLRQISKLTGLQKEEASIFAEIDFPSQHGSLSAKAIRKILPYMKQGLEYSSACREVGYVVQKKQLDRLEQLPHNSLRNPVVEAILNQMVHVVNAIIDTYGQLDEIHIEMARELKKSAEERHQIIERNEAANKRNQAVKAKIEKEFAGVKPVSSTDVLRYRLYQELLTKDGKAYTLYSETQIKPEELFSDKFEIEHIIPQALLYDDSFANKTLETHKANNEKDARTAYDYVFERHGEEKANKYKQRVEELRKAIGETKYKNLLMTRAELSDGFIERDLRNTQYIAKKAHEMLGQIAKDVVPTTGAITKKLREDWGLVDLMKELNWDKYDKIGLTETFIKKKREIRQIKDWTKRNDHRHHAMDALVIAFTTPSIIQYLNTLHAVGEMPHGMFRVPYDEFRAEAKSALENILISVKAKNKVMTKAKSDKSKKGKSSIHLIPRRELHRDSVYGVREIEKEIKVDEKLTEELILKVKEEQYRHALLLRLSAYGGDATKAFSGENALNKNPIYINEQQTEKVPDTVTVIIPQYTIRKAINKDLNVEKVINKNIRDILTARLKEFGGNKAKAFSNLDENPIWLNKDAGICIKKVTVESHDKQLIPLRDKKDHNGNFILNETKNRIPVDFVSTHGNHHAAIFRDAQGKIHEQVVSFFEVAQRAARHEAIIDKEYNKDKGWTFLFTIKKNEYFVFPHQETGFDPHAIDLMNPDNYELISKHLYRVQNLSAGDYSFRHHLETNDKEKNLKSKDNKKEQSKETNEKLKGVTWNRLKSLSALASIVKVRVNHIGQIVFVGEY